MKRLLHFLLALLVFAPGCSLDEGGSPIGISSPGGGITFTLAMPDPNTGPASYALYEARENVVETLDVFAFKKETFGNYILEEHVKVDATEIITDPQNSRYKSFNVSFFELKENRDYVFVIIANGRDLIGDPTTYIGQNREGIMANFTLNGINRWIDTERNIPMWGETEEIKLENNMKVEDVTLLRMLSKIDVEIEPTSIFKLQSVRLYNYHTGGYLVPSRDKFTSISMDTVKAPTPYNERKLYPEEPLIFSYEYDYDKGFTEENCKSLIYTFESEVPKIANNPDGPVDFERVHCVVIGGIYTNGHAQKETYYRVNFVDLSKDTIHHDLLRNHRYTLKVISVKGDGHDKPEEAFKAKTSDMEVEVIPWNDARMTEFVFDGTNVLTVTKGKWTFTKEERKEDIVYGDNIIDIYTDVPGGWKVDTTIYSPVLGVGEKGWLELNPYEGTKGGTTSQLLLTENKTGSPRTGYIYLKAGRLVYKLEVTQLETGFVPVSSISIPDSITIKKGESASITATILPGNATNQDITWESDSLTIATVTQEGRIYAHKAGIATITVRATDGSGAYDTCVVTIPSTFFPVEGIALNKSATTIPEGGQEQLIPTITPDTATIQAVKWESDDPFTASVASDGTVYGHKAGTATITATTVDGGYTATCEVTVGAPPVDVLDISLNPTTATIYKGNSRLIKATVSPAEAADQIQWTSSNDNIATVDGNGNVTAVNVGGPVIITAKIGNMSAICTVTVTEAYYPIKSTRWAGSNIYWDKDSSKLKFDNENVTINEKYQGVYFKWGGLWGISSLSYYNLSRTIYKPDKMASESGIPWDSIPYVDTPSSITADRDRAYLYEVTGESTSKGDICRYLTLQNGGSIYGEKWRMPTSNEMEYWHGATRYGVWGISDDHSDKADGTYSIKAVLSKNGVSLPANGAGHPINNYVGRRGLYWSSSPWDEYGAHLLFTNDIIHPEWYTWRYTSQAIRCVVDVEE